MSDGTKTVQIGRNHVKLISQQVSDSVWEYKLTSTTRNRTPWGVYLMAIGCVAWQVLTFHADELWHMPLGYRVAVIATSLFLWAKLLWWLYARGTVTEESLIVIQELGVEMRTKFRSGTEAYRFIEKAEISDIIINEGITFSRVVYYMAFIVQNQDKLVVAFEHFNPGLQVLQTIYSGTRKIVLGA